MIGHGGIGHQHHRGEALNEGRDVRNGDTEDSCPRCGLVWVLLQEGDELILIARSVVQCAPVEAGGVRVDRAHSVGGRRCDCEVGAHRWGECGCGGVDRFSAQRHHIVVGAAEDSTEQEDATTDEHETQQ